MCKIFFKIALRNFYRDKMYVLINILGLSLGITCCIILGLYLRSELTYDQHHKNHKRIFRVILEHNNNGKVINLPITPWPVGDLMAREYPDIRAFVRFSTLISRDVPGSGNLFRHENTGYYWKDVYGVDENIFEVFTHRAIYGDLKNPFPDPTAIAVSESFARKYFGDANPIGETISSDAFQYKISLVYADCPENSHLKYDVLISNRRNFDTDDASILRTWLWNRPAPFTYFLMPEGYQAHEFKEISDSFYIRYMADEGKKRNSTRRFWLQPLVDIHLESDLPYDLPTGNKLYVYGFSAIAIFIILLACINYMNLATARSVRRAREVGMRKVLGATRFQLIFQFLGESTFYSLIALIISLMFVKLVLNLTPFIQLTGKRYLMNLSNEPGLILWMLGFSVLIGLISGSYPAFYLSSIRPLSALKSTQKPGKWRIQLRQALVFIQFLISIGVVTCMLLIVGQMKYIADKPLGFNKDNKVLIRIRGADQIKKIPVIRTELLKNHRILSVSTSATILGQGGNLLELPVENNDGSMNLQTIATLAVDEYFLKTMDIQLVAGRDFSKALPTDTEMSLIVNEAFEKKMGWEQPLGKRIGSGRIIGVAKDFHHQSLHQQIAPLEIYLHQDFGASNLRPLYRALASRILILNISSEDIKDTLSYTEDIIRHFDPKHPFEFEFMDNALDRLYVSEKRLMKLTAIFSGICILISCLGLIGLSAFTAEQRTKEIGIRKILGASATQIIIMLSRNILLLAMGASVISSLTAYFIMDDWLAGFAYRADINLLIFLLSALAAVAVASLAIAPQCLKAAQANPVLALQYE